MNQNIGSSIYELPKYMTSSKKGKITLPQSLAFPVETPNFDDDLSQCHHGQAVYLGIYCCV
jgi:hypothetical protein